MLLFFILTSLDNDVKSPRKTWFWVINWHGKASNDAWSKRGVMTWLVFQPKVFGYNSHLHTFNEMTPPWLSTLIIHSLSAFILYIERVDSRASMATPLRQCRTAFLLKGDIAAGSCLNPYHHKSEASPWTACILHTKSHEKTSPVIALGSLGQPKQSPLCAEMMKLTWLKMGFY